MKGVGDGQIFIGVQVINHSTEDAVRKPLGLAECQPLSVSGEAVSVKLGKDAKDKIGVPF